MALEIVIAIETLGALIAFEWAIGHGTRHAMMGRGVSAIEMLRAGKVTAVEPRQNARLHAPHHRHGAVGTVNVGHDRTGHGGKGVGRPRLTGIGQGRLSTGTLEGHSCAGMHDRIPMAPERIVTGIHG